MSFQAMAWAVGLKLPAREKFVLLMLANYASNERGDCYPSLGRLCDDTSMSRHTVIEALRGLESMRAIQIVRREQDGVSLPNVYRLNLGWQGGSAAAAPPVQQMHGGSAATAPEPINEPITKKKEERARVSLDAEGCFVVPESIMAAYQTAYGRFIDVQAQIAAAEAWCRSNLSRRPKKDFGRFLNGWLHRATKDACRPRLAAVGGAAVGRKAAGDRMAADLFSDHPTNRGGNDVVDVVATEAR